MIPPASAAAAREATKQMILVYKISNSIKPRIIFIRRRARLYFRLALRVIIFMSPSERMVVCIGVYYIFLLFILLQVI